MGVLLAVIGSVAFMLNLIVVFWWGVPFLRTKIGNWRKSRYDKKMAKVIGNISVEVEDPAVLMGLKPLVTLVADEALPIAEKCVGVELSGIFVMKNERVVLVFSNDESFTITSNITWPSNHPLFKVGSHLKNPAMGVRAFDHQGKKIKLEKFEGAKLISFQRKGHTGDKVESGKMYKHEAEWMILKFDVGLLGIEFSVKRTPGENVVRTYLIKTE
ncbi:hypothetical protein DLP05_093 [Stenotrophomonas phage vB_SmaS_DLP_5]|uniref:Uncharacterized protein n=1 Tax=Stenotrophomonas phage vB_SmaS_DLP_5 TaxID=2044561 RepID=A0A2D2W2L9_9CAUD|nr:hypothetical protein FDJ07_gp128 [Stenotrophomonas phage vB_SmaS_DLP_5]ATS92319.1 hypothetical protein DLP05_093 [Stenotrophomonas phage vB_SmaS_DLP_5]